MSSRRLGAALVALSLAASGSPATSPSPTKTAGQVDEASVRPSEATASGPPVCPETPASAPVAPWWQGRVFYELFVRSFADSDGDGIGDLRGLPARSGYVLELREAT
jgi:hypothetical protein